MSEYTLSGAVLSEFPVSGALTMAAVAPRRLSELPLECAIERRFRLIPDIRRNVRYASRCLFQRSCRHLKPPACQVRHRRLRKISGEALHQSGARDAHFVRQNRDRPLVSDAAVKQCEALPHDRIACSREPARLLLRQSADVAP